MKKVIALGFILVLCIFLAFFVFASGGKDDKGKVADKGPEPVELVVWWWGESEAPGLEAWMNETVAMFEAEYPHIDVETLLQAVDNVIDDFTTASAAGSPPDVQFLWNGVYHQENVWRGYLEPLNNLLTPEELKHMYATDLSIYKGQQYRIGWYVVPFGMVYNRELFKQAGLSDPPELWEWDDFIDACEQLKRAGITPLGFGFKDGWWGEWYTALTIYQQADEIEDIAKLITGENKWTNPRWHEHWKRAYQLIEAGYVNDDANSLAHYQGIELFNADKVAMSTTVGSLVGEAEKSLGAENVGLTNFPRFGTGSFRDLPLTDIQGWGVSAQSKHKEEATEFLRFMHRPDRLSAQFKMANVFPADDRWQGEKEITNPNIKLMWKWFKGGSAVYLPNMIPWTFDSEVMFTAPQFFMSGTHTPEGVGQLAEDVMGRWREENPDLYESMKIWFNL